LLAYALRGIVRQRRCALAWELAQRLRLTGGVLVLPEEVAYEVGLVEQLEYNYVLPRYVFHDVKGGFVAVSRGRGREVKLPSVQPFVAIRKAGAFFYWRGSEGYLRAPALKILSGRYKGLFVLLIEPGSAARDAALEGARVVYRSSPNGALLELKWDGGSGVAARAALRLKTDMWRRRYVTVVELRLLKPGTAHFTVERRSAKLLVLPELNADLARRALGFEAVFAGDPTGAPAELEVAVYKLTGGKSRVIPLSPPT